MADEQEDFEDGPPRNRREQLKAQKLFLERRDQGLRMLLSNPNGRAALAWILRDLCAMHGPSVGQDFKPEPTFLREGQRSVALYLTQEALRLDKAGFMLVLEESLNSP